jgi:hypothetical protein
MSDKTTGRFKIVFSDSDTLRPGRFIEVTRVAGQAFFLFQLLDNNTKILTELCQRAAFEGNSRFVDTAAGLEVAYHPKGPNGTAFLYGSVQDGRNRSIFVAEDDGGKGDEK